MKNNGGFTMTELMVVVAVIGIMVAVAAPPLSDYMKSTNLREANQTIVSHLLNARQHAVSLNREVRVTVVLDAGASNGNNTIVLENADGTDIAPIKTLPVGVEIRANGDCSVTTGTISLTFNPDGSSSSRYLCIMDGTANRYQAGVSSSTTGKVVSRTWSGGAWK